MLFIVFYLNLRLKYDVEYLFLFFSKYLRVPWILKNYTGTRITDAQWIWVWVQDRYLSSR